MVNAVKKIPGGLLVGDFKDVEVATEKVATETPIKPTRKPRKVKENEETKVEE